MKETREARKERHALELWQFCDVLRRAGNIVEEELRFDVRPADPTQEPRIPRLWRFDVALPYCEVRLGVRPTRYEMIAVEIEGMGGRHQTMKGFRSDVEKYAEGFAQGWTILRVTRRMIADGTALDALARRGVTVEAKEKP